VTTLSDAVTAYKICAKAEGKSPKTISWVTDAVRYFSDFLGDGHHDLSKVTVHDLRRFILALRNAKAYSHHRFTRPQDRPLSPQSIVSYVGAIKSFFSFLAREQIIPSNPMDNVTLKVPKKVIATFSEAQLQRLLAQPDKGTVEGYRDYTIMLTLLDTGARLGELMGLKLGDVDLEQGYLKVTGKGSRERYLPIGAKVTKALLKYRIRRAETTWDNFFVTKDGRPLTLRRVQAVIKRYGEKAKVSGVRCSPHTFRHTSCVMYLRNGGDPFTLQKKLGHSSLQMTRHYSNLVDADVRAAHLKHGPADRLNV